MIEPLDPIDREIFARGLREFDRAVSLDVPSLTQSVAARRNRKRRAKRLALVAIPVIAALAFGLMVFNPNSVSKPIVIKAAESNNLPGSEIADADSNFEITERLVDFLQLETQQAKLLALQQEIESLKRDQENHDWILARERISRTEIAKSMAAVGL